MRERGVALIVILAALVLISGLVLAFLATAKTERAAASSNLRLTEARVLADSALSLVTAQVRAATTEADTLWSSQPGVIWTWTGNGSSRKAFKLYSAAEMVQKDFDPYLKTDVPGDWHTRPDEFSDLNSPVVIDGKAQYPVLDPTLAWSDGRGEGLPGFENRSGQEGMVSSAADANPIPMPVRWLYLLKDGTIEPMVGGRVASANDTDKQIIGRVAFWTDDETAKVNINTASAGTFWDVPRGSGEGDGGETFLPTQFEGGRWVEGSFNVQSGGLANTQPVQGEYQRYPGHPATTSLLSIFDGTLAGGSKLFWPGTTDPQERREKVYALAPRVHGEGSFGGTVTVDPNKTDPTDFLDIRNDRLYASVDELAFGQPTTPSDDREDALSSPAKENGIDPEDLDAVRFFMTAHSRSPEVNMFNKPKVTLWPVDVDPAKRTPLDKTIAFCSTLRKAGSTDETLMAITRKAFDPTEIKAVGLPVSSAQPKSGALSPSVDYNPNNQKLYAYLQSLFGATIPGYGRDFRSKFGSDSDQVVTQVFDYARLTNLFDISGPNAAGNVFPYTAKPLLGSQLVSVGTRDAPWSAVSSIYKISDFNLNPANFDASTYDDTNPLFVGQVIPLRVGATQGVGRYATVTGAALVFLALEPSVDHLDKKYKLPANATDLNNLKAAFNTPPPLSASGYSYQDSGGGTVAATIDYTDAVFDNYPAPKAPAYPASWMQCMLVLQYAVPANSSMIFGNRMNYVVTGMNSIKITSAGSTVDAGPASATIYSYATPDGSLKTGGVPDHNNFRRFTSTNSSSNFNFKVYDAQTDSSSTVSQYYKLVSSPIRVDGSQFLASQGTITVDARLGANKIQTTTLKFEQFQALPPRWAKLGAQQGNNSQAPKWYWDRVWNRAKGSGREPYAFPISNEADPTPGDPGEIDTVRMIEMRGDGAPWGDSRLVAARDTVPEAFFAPHKDYSDSTKRHAHSLRLRNGVHGILADVDSSINTADHIRFLGLPSKLVAAKRADGGPGDWDAGMPDGHGTQNIDRLNYLATAGAFINKTEDTRGAFFSSEKKDLPFFGSGTPLVNTSLTLTPNRILPSAVMLGSLPVGVKRNLPWQTLLFRPAEQTGGPTHPGATSPPDHLLLDLFHVPVVEPYAISEPFSTAGKINLNSGIVPFTYIERTTGLRAVLDGMRVTAVPGDNAYLRKQGSAADATNIRYPINLDATVEIFKDREKTSGPFKSASEICEMPLVPLPENLRNPPQPQAASVTPYQTSLQSNPSAAQARSYVNSFWSAKNGGLGTADNLRERPYAALYPRVTTKSNTFTVHLRVQSLQKAKGSDPATFEGAKGGVMAEYRGSYTIERYLDPNATDFDIGQSASVLGPYKFRVVNTKKFNP